MTDKAIIEGCYVDLKFLPGLKSARVFVDIPIEYSNLFLKMFDAPDRASPVRVAIARLATPTAEPLAVAAQAAPIPDKAEAARIELTRIGQEMGDYDLPPKPRTPFRDMPRSQQAALKLEDEAFQRWIGPHRTMTSESAWKRVCDDMLKAKLEIDSKRELDSDPIKGTKWDALLTDFDNRQHMR